MIAQIIEADHTAGQEAFAVVGNATQPAWDARAGEMDGFATLWDTHGTMMERAIFPRLAAAAGGAALIEALRDLQRQVTGAATDLARRAAARDEGGTWLTDFEALKRLFEAQCLRESTDLVPLIRERLPPDDIAAMTRDARALRQGKSA